MNPIQSAPSGGTRTAIDRPREDSLPLRTDDTQTHEAFSMFLNKHTHF